MFQFALIVQLLDECGFMCRHAYEQDERVSQEEVSIVGYTFGIYRLID